MITHTLRARTEQGGIVLVSSLLLLLVVTIMALAMFRSFGIQEKIAGNMREKQRALQAAVSAQQYAEWWLMNYSSGYPAVACTALLNANQGEGQICNLLPANVANVPYTVGVTYTPPGGMQISTTTTATTNSIVNPTYFNAPAFYITDLGPSSDSSLPGEIYQIDAAGYGGNSNTVAVVESTYNVYVSSSNPTY